MIALLTYFLLFLIHRNVFGTISAMTSHVNLNPRFVVLKFGGTSVSTKTRWQTIAELMRKSASDGRKVVVVVSALSGVTNQLQSVIDHHDDLDDCLARARLIAQRHALFAQELGLRTDSIDSWIVRLDQLIRDSRRILASFDWQAEVLSLGELFSSSLGGAYLSSMGVATTWLDARAYLCAFETPNQSEWAKYLSVNCKTQSDLQLQNNLSAQSNFFITQGFIARNQDAHTVILGRGGSDTSAAYFGALLNAERVEIWTDVAGMFSANPREVKEARLLTRLDYAEAQEIATTGAKVLHPRAIGPVRDANVPLWIKDTNRPDLPGTLIVAEAARDAPGVKAISSRKGITLVSMETVGMWQQVGFLADVFSEFKRHGLSVDLIGAAETNVTVSLDPSENLVNSDVLAALCRDLEKICRVKVIAPCISITLVGRGMRRMLHQLTPVMAEFGQHNVHLISQSSNDLNLTFVLDEAIGESMVPRLHHILTEANAMPLDDAAVFGARWDDLYQPETTPVESVPWWRTDAGKLSAMAREISPRYVYSTAAVRASVVHLKSLRAVDRRFYAVKANAHPQLLRLIFDLGLGLECVSLAEIDLVKKTIPEIDFKEILFTPNFAARDEYAAAFERGVMVTIDALHPLEHWGDLLRGRELFLRLDLGRGLGHHAKVKTGGNDSKFGIPLRALDQVHSRVRALGVRVIGLHAHLGSGIVDVDHWRSVYFDLLALAGQFPGVRSLNIGGGFGVAARATDPILDFAKLDTVLLEVKNSAPDYSLWIEPGRFVVAEAGVLLSRVTQIKEKDERTFLGVDVGMNSLIRPALYDAWHQIENLDRLDAGADAIYDVVGPICESGDVLGRRRRMPTAQEGDVILIAQAGAYGAVMGSNYNSRAPADEVVI